MKRIAFKDGQFHSILEDEEKTDGTGSVSVTVQPVGADTVLPISDEDFASILEGGKEVKLSKDKKSVEISK